MYKITCVSVEGPILAKLIETLSKGLSAYERLESEEYQDIIANIAKDLGIHTWEVHESEQPDAFDLEITRFFDQEFGSNEKKELNRILDDFVSAVGNAILPVFDKKEQDCPTHEPANEEAEVLAEELDFVKSLKEDADTLRGALIIPCGIPTAFAVVADACHVASHACLIRMIDAYLEKYDHE